MAEPQNKTVQDVLGEERRKQFAAQFTTGEHQGLMPSLPEEEAQEEDRGFLSGLFGGAASVLGKVSNVISYPEHIVAGYVESERQAEREIEEQTGRNIPWGMASFDPEVRERRKRISNAAGGVYQYWQQYESTFKGEKFIKEQITSPYNLLLATGIGSAGRVKILQTQQASRFGAKGLGLLAKKFAKPLGETEVRQKVLSGSQSYGIVPTVKELTQAGFVSNGARRAATTFSSRAKDKLGYKQIPLIGRAINLVNPSGLLDAAEKGDRLAINLIVNTRLEKRMSNVVTRDIANLRNMEAQGVVPFHVGKGGNLYTWVTRTKDKGGRLIPEARRVLEEVPLQDAVERYGSFSWSDEQVGFFKELFRAVDVYRGRAVSEGVDVSMVLLQRGEHYLPRFITALKEVMDMRSVKPSGAIGAKAPFQRSRLNDYIEAGIDSGHTYYGAGSKTPLSDIVEVYMRGMMNVRAHNSLAKAIRPMGTTLKQRIPIELQRRAWVEAKRLQRAKRALRHIKDAERGKVLTMGAIGTIKRFDNDIGRAFEIVHHEGIQMAGRSQTGQRMITGHLYRERAENLVELASLRYREVRMARKSAADALARPFGQMQIPHPAFAGRYFPREMVQEVIQFLDPQVNKMLENVGDIGNLMRTGQLTMDGGFGLIQGLMLVYRAPLTWLKATKESLYALIDPTVARKYIGQVDTQETLAFYRGAIHLGATEFTAGITKGLGQGERIGLAPRIAKKLHAERLFDETLGRAQAAFEVYFDVARIQFAKGFMPLVRSGKVSREEVSEFANKITGVMSTRELGIGATQAELESALLFLAPRYTRAAGALFLDIAQGGFRGDQARKAMVAMFGGTVATYIGLCGAFGQKPKLDPRSPQQGGDGGKFMTIEIQGHHIGLGSKPYSMARTMAKIISDPAGAASYAALWLRGSASPVTGAAVDILTGKSYMGEPVGPNIDGFRQLGGRFLPFYLEALINDTPRPGMAGTAAEFFGFRSYPVQFSERRDDIRDELASMYPVERLSKDQVQYMETEGPGVPTWEMLTTSQKIRIEAGKTGIKDIDTRIPELTVWADKASALIKERGREEITAFFEDRESVKTQWNLESKKFATAVQEGREDPSWFLGRMSDLNIGTSALNEGIYDPEGRHADALLYFDERKTDADFVPLGDLARDEYIAQLVATNDLEDSDGNYLFDVAERRLNTLRKKYGFNLIQEIENSFLLSKETPALWRLWVSDRDILRPYWEISERYLNDNPKVRHVYDALQRARATGDLRREERLRKHGLIRRMDRQVSAERSVLRRRRPDIDGALRFWGKTTRFLSRESIRQYNSRWDIAKSS